MKQKLFGAKQGAGKSKKPEVRRAGHASVTTSVSAMFSPPAASEQLDRVNELMGIPNSNCPIL